MRRRDGQIELPEKFRRHRLLRGFAGRVVAMCEMIKSAEQKTIPMADEADGFKRSNAAGEAGNLWHGSKIGMAVVNEWRTVMPFHQLARGGNCANNVAHAGEPRKNYRPPARPQNHRQHHAHDIAQRRRMTRQQREEMIFLSGIRRHTISVRFPRANGKRVGIGLKCRWKNWRLVFSISMNAANPMKEFSNLSVRDIGFFSEAATANGVAITAETIDVILASLPARNRWCVEFGAWDGLAGSTSRHLIIKQNYSAVLIEGDAERFAGLKKNYAGRADIITRNQFVGFTAEDGLDAILAGTPVPFDFDFLTVDIDGNDYHVWNAVVKYRPKIVMIEFNPTIPPEVSFIQPANPNVSQGSSLAALVELGKKKNYELVAVLGVNAFFTTAELFPLFGLADNRIETLWTERDCVTYFFMGYDGRIFLRGCRKLPWHEGMPFREEQVQVLPRFLQRYPWTRTHRRLYIALTNPSEVIRKIFRRLVG